MRIAILSGAFLLVSSAVTSAATVSFSYETHTLEYATPSSYFGVSPSEYGKIVSRFDIEVPSLKNIQYKLEFFEGILAEHGGSVIRGYVDQAASVFGFSVLPGYAIFSTDEDGNLLNASVAGYGDSPDVEISGSSAFLYQGNGEAIFKGSGKWTVSVLDPSPVPLPATAPLIAVALGALGWLRRRRS